jgi:teichuronic acid exporter
MPEVNKFTPKNAMIFITGSLGKFTINFFSIVILARLITPGEYGLWVQLFATFSILQIFFEFGQLNILVAQVKHFDRMFRSLIVYNIFASLLVYLIIFGIFSLVLNGDNYSLSIIVCLMLYLPCTLLSQLLFIKIQTLNRFTVVNIIPILLLVIGNIVGISLAYLGYGIDSLAIKLLVESLLGLLIATKLSGSYLYNNIPRTFEIKILFSNANIFTGLSDVLIKMSNHIDKLVLAIFLSPGNLGFYSRCYNFAMIGVSIAGYSLTSLGMQSGAQKNTIKLYANSMFWSYLILFTFLSFHVLYFHSDKIFSVILGSQWIEYVQHSWIVSFLPSLKFLENYMYMILVSDNKQGYMPIFFVIAYSASFSACLVLFNYGINIYEVIFYFFMVSFFIYAVILAYYLFKVSSLRENSAKCFNIVGVGSSYFLYVNYSPNLESETLLILFFDISAGLVVVAISIFLSNLLVGRKFW